MKSGEIFTALDPSQDTTYNPAVPFTAESISAKPLRTTVLLSLFLFLSGNWILPLMDRDEPKFAEASREMLQRKDLLIPWFNGEYRFDKPPLIYWCQAASFKVMGENAFAARFPSVIFATGTAMLLLFWGRRLGNARTGFYAAIVFVTCLQVLIHARLAVADMPMIFFVTAALWSGWEMTRPQTPGARWWWTFYLSLGLGFLAKGPVAWLPLAGLLWGRWLRPREFHLPLPGLVAGMLVALLLVGLWGVPALLATQGQFFTVGVGRHVVFRSLGIMEGHGGSGWLGFLLTIPLYFVTFFISFFPWALRMPRALREWWSSRHVDSLGWYLIVQATVVFAVFTVVRTKLPHYTLPAFPALSLWLGLRLNQQQNSAEWVRRRAEAMCMLAALITLVLFTVARSYFVALNLYHQASPVFSPNTEFATVGFDEPSLVWEFRRMTTNYMQHLTMDQARTFLQREGPRMLIVSQNELAGVQREAGTNVLTFQSSGLDTARFRRISLALVVKTAN